MHTDTFQKLTDDLRSLGGRRVWSLMISLFGDLAQNKGEGIDGPLLSAIMAEMQVKPEAARVALHRLRNDGWIVSVKSGRISQHSLSAEGRAQTIAASPQIYADPRAPIAHWQLVMTPDSTPQLTQEMLRRGFTTLAPRIFAGPKEATAPANMLVLPASDAPDWLRHQIAPPGFDDLLNTLSDLQSRLPAPGALSPVQTAVLRCLVVHNWRRLVLKNPMPPAALADPAGTAHRCHLLVADLLTRFPRPRMTDIEQSCAAA